MRKALGMVLSLLLACMPVFAAQEADRTRMSKDHQRAYDAALALYGTYNGITHFLCSTTVVAEKEVASQTGKQHEYLLLTAGHCIVGEGLPVGLEFGVRPDIKPESPKPELEPVQVLRAENDAKFDFALLSLTSSNIYPYIPIDFNYVPQLEDEVYDVNFTEGIVKQVSLGKVSSKIIDQPSSPQGCDICSGRFMVQIFAGPGASGSAVINAKTHRVIGVGEFGFNGITIGLGVEPTSLLKTWILTPVKEPVSPKEQHLQEPKIAAGR